MYRCNFEAEADLFAAEAFFFGQKFHEQAFSGDVGLASAIELATSVYGTSLHSTFAHYVEESPLPLCLLVWKTENRNGSTQPCGKSALHYFCEVKGIPDMYVDAENISDPDEVVSQIALRLGTRRHQTPDDTYR